MTKLLLKLISLLIVLLTFGSQFVGCSEPLILSDEEKVAIKDENLLEYREILAQIGFQSQGEPVEKNIAVEVNWITGNYVPFNSMEKFITKKYSKRMTARLINCGSENFVNSRTGDAITLTVLKIVKLFENTSLFGEGDIIVTINYSPIYCAQNGDCPEGEVIGVMGIFEEFYLPDPSLDYLKEALPGVWAWHAVSVERYEATDESVLAFRDDVIEKYLK